MTLNADLKAINCTACGAGLDVLGGGRVTSHICSYCGTELDVLDDYKALRKFNDVARPNTLFPIGTTGHLRGADYTVIGLLEHVEKWQGRSWAWLDHQLYSPTHGYAWLTVENGHATFSRRYRRPVWMSHRDVEISDHRPQLNEAGETFQYYETSTSTISYAEGEFTWSPQKGARTTTVSALSDTAMLSFSQTNQEREVSRTTYVPAAELAAAFGTDLDLSPAQTHPLQPFAGRENDGFLIKASALCAVICLCLATWIVSKPKHEVLAYQRLDISELPRSITLEIPEPDKRVQVSFNGNSSNSWTALGVHLEDPNGEDVFEVARTVEYYHGRDRDGSWSEGRNFARLSFIPKTVGAYVLTVAHEGTGTEGRSAKPTEYVGLTARMGSGVSGYLFGLAFAFAALMAWPIARRYTHKTRRWHGSDWSED